MLKLALSEYVFGTYDFGRNVTFKTYDETNTAFNATGYTGKIKVADVSGAQIIPDISVSWTTQSSGIGTFAFTSTNRPQFIGYFYIELELTKSGSQVSTIPARVHFRASPDV